MMLFRREGLLPETRTRQVLQEPERGELESVGADLAGGADLRGDDGMTAAASHGPATAAGPLAEHCTPTTSPSSSAAWSRSTTSSFTIPEAAIVSLIGPERRRQDDVLQRAHRPLPADRGRGATSASADVTGHPAAQASPAMGLARTFQNIRLFNLMTAEENVMVAMHSAPEGRACSATVLPTPRQRREEREAPRVRPRAARLRRHRQDRGRATPATSPTATSAGWRSPGRWRCGPRCCCSTSRRPA